MLRDEVDMINAIMSLTAHIFQASESNCCLDLKELEAMLNNPQFVAQVEHTHRDTSQALTMLRLFDGGRSGTVSRAEFIGDCLRLRRSAKSTDMLTLPLEAMKASSCHKRGYDKLCDKILEFMEVSIGTLTCPERN
mmetsp:Transcript_2366/g.4467  ORF Transcript_2366/g.4467 Transcript_2366/m.4467 type:complete len:136 (+) Transcript_2366:1-408(+)